MSTKIVNGKCIEVLSDDDEPETYIFGYSNATFNHYPGFFEPKPVSPKTQSTDFKAFKSKFVFGKRDSILGKRKADEAFGPNSYDEDRYGQNINNEYFKNNIGHGVKNEPNTNLKTDVKFTTSSDGTSADVYEDEDFEANLPPELKEALVWLEKYRENKRNGKELFDMYN